MIRQAIHQGDEQVSGYVCNTSAPFAAHMVTSKITFDIAFVPQSQDAGTWTYAYSFPDLGESHDASGTYTIAVASPDGVRSLQMDGQDHVVFTGFDGNIPRTYRFDLVPGAVPVCP